MLPGKTTIRPSGSCGHRRRGDKQRAGFRHFLREQHYDTANEDLMLNEAQAYLVHTNDTRDFLPDRAGLAEEEAARLREIFVRGMPDGWLKTAAQASNPRPTGDQ